MTQCEDGRVTGGGDVLHLPARHLPFEKGLQLFSSHVIVEADLVDHVRDLVSRVHRGVYPTGSEIVCPRF